MNTIVSKIITAQENAKLHIAAAESIMQRRPEGACRAAWFRECQARGEVPALPECGFDARDLRFKSRPVRHVQVSTDNIRDLWVSNESGTVIDRISLRGEGWQAEVAAVLETQ